MTVAGVPHICEAATVEVSSEDQGSGEALVHSRQDRFQVRDDRISCTGMDAHQPEQVLIPRNASDGHLAVHRDLLDRSGFNYLEQRRVDRRIPTPGCSPSEEA